MNGEGHRLCAARRGPAPAKCSRARSRLGDFGPVTNKRQDGKFSWGAEATTVVTDVEI
jgi:hypothetical protein